jgi:fatty acid desaturase
MTLPPEPRDCSNLNTSDRRTALLRRLRRFARNVFLAVAALVVLWIAIPAVVLRPPEPLAVPQRGFMLSRVTIVNPGIARNAHQTITVSGG